MLMMHLNCSVEQSNDAETFQVTKFKYFLVV